MGKRLLLHGGLFVLTIASTFYAGGAEYGDYRGGAIYSMAIMVILLSHEMSHYLTSRHYRVPSSLPYFLPFPLSPFGTLGAVIRMSGVIRDKKTLFDIGISGPLCSFVLSVPCLVMGIMLSQAVRVPPSAHSLLFGESLLSILLQRLLVGDLPNGYTLLIHPLGFAGWVGLFITALNLLPIGQLDGGHTVYAVLGRKSRYVNRLLIPLLALLAVFFNVGWFTLMVLLLVFGIGHPDPLDPWTPLDRGRKALALFMLFVFVLSFVPAPFEGTSLIQLVGGLAGPHK